MRTVILPYKMMFERKRLPAAPLLILVMNIFRGQTLTCHRSEYEIGNRCCLRCPAGNRVRTDCTVEFTSTSCLPCMDRTYMNKPTGLKQCFPCTICDAGSGLKVKTPCTATSNTVCEPLEGFYCMNSAVDGCVTQKHKSCQPGQYISQKGTALSDTVCSACSDGTFSDGTFTSCQPHTQCGPDNSQLMKAGTASTDAECGEKHSDQTTVIAVVVSVGLFLVIGASLFILWILRKKKIFPKKNRKRNGDDPKQEHLNGGETVDQMIRDGCEQLQDAARHT